ncbi:penicillin-binding protein activator LpoB [Chlorobium phaeovibrioides]|uniref:Penicillin-binding protein activator LpoB n=3 Tax=Chlorobium phaeovibrioides TaxID=1094 RepID=A0A5M8IBI4_CHLPH|nr:penicillin-binding protein activator LpoB [Chlorobium phaeovibrioides]MWV54177.1 penicillin-binding protein activator LpoB [Chlorobium phaeovibrioides]QEQ57619.1 penicillin-binding protein activator LpoB [Chlorobium phaeovibrioides]HCD36883.1 penicillin-binding protein activator LpoB [Chlorobium sp.]
MAMRKYIPFIIALLFLPGMAGAAGAVTQVEITGYGATRQEAIRDGLTEAIRQNNGVRISSGKEYQKNDVPLPWPGDTLAVRPVGEMQLVGSDVRETSKGTVRQYRVMDERQLEDGQWAARLLVAFTHYRSPGVASQNRRRIAVLPFQASQFSFMFGGREVPSDEISSRLSQRLVAELTQSRRFSVLDREYLSAYLQEKHLILSEDAADDELLKMGAVLGVDYMLVGTIAEAGERSSGVLIPMTGEQVQESSASLVVDYRIIVMATREIKWAGTETVALDKPTGGPDALCREAARMVVQHAMANIYPLQIVGSNAAGEVLINQGGITLQVGELLDVFAAGEKVFDPYTKESLGASESRIGRVRVVRVSAKKSYAEVVEGELEAMASGSICRRGGETAALPPEGGKPSSIRFSGSGGVLLPFDR